MGVTVTEANGTAERDAALTILDHLERRHGRKPRTLGMDKGYDSGPHYLKLEKRRITPHAAMTSAQAGPDARPPAAGRVAEVAARQRMRDRLADAAYGASQRCRKKVEECFGWVKGIAGLARSRWVGRWKLRQQLELAAAAYNLLRMRSLKRAGIPK